MRCLRFLFIVLLLLPLWVCNGGAPEAATETEFLPQVDDGHVTVRLSLPPGTPPSVTDAAFRRIEQVVMDMPCVESVFTTSGGGLWGA